MAMPLRVLALLPPETWSVVSLKREANKLDTVSPGGLPVSSLIDASVAVPLATGASLVGVTVTLMVSVAVLKLAGSTVKLWVPLAVVRVRVQLPIVPASKPVSSLT